MAKLVTTKEKYGVSVATRIDTDMAQQIAERAERLGISFSKMVGMLISRGFNPQEPVYLENREEVERLERLNSELRIELQNLQQELAINTELYKNSAAEFIVRVAMDDDEKIRFIETYNEVLHEQRGNSESN